VYFYGHGALLRHQALAIVGGFPEITAEDVALTTKLRMAGYRGYFASEIESFEEAPRSYQAFRRRNEKIVTGTLEFIFKYCLSFLRATNVSLTEKADLLIATSLIYLPIAFVCFISLFNLQILFFAQEHAGHSLVLLPFQGQYVRVINELFLPFQSRSMVTFLFFVTFAPLCYLIPSALRNPLRTFRYVLRMGAVHLSVCMRIFWVVFRWFLHRRTIFIPTGDRSNRATPPLEQYAELCVGIVLLIAGTIIGSLSLMSVGISLILVPMLNKSDLRRPTVSILVTLPVLLAIIAVLGIPMAVVGLIGLFSSMDIAHA
jgi:cellulose synthase/poly-beta-1,6-N-acetylglucosamine synthase-like glycosyltransferase